MFAAKRRGTELSLLKAGMHTGLDKVLIYPQNHVIVPR